MSEEKEEYIRYRMKRAHEALEEAAALWALTHYNAAVNRIYYSCFYAVSALLLHDGYKSNTHSGTRTLFAQHYTRTGRIDRDLGKFYLDLFDRRQEADYKDNFEVDPATAEPWLVRAQEFVQTIEGMISK